MSYYMSSGTLNPTHSLTHSNNNYVPVFLAVSLAEKTVVCIVGYVWFLGLGAYTCRAWVHQPITGSGSRNRAPSVG